MQEDEHVYVWKKLRVDDVVVGFFHLEKLEAVADAARVIRGLSRIGLLATEADYDMLADAHDALADALDALDD